MRDSHNEDTTMSRLIRTVTLRAPSGEQDDSEKARQIMHEKELVPRRLPGEFTLDLMGPRPTLLAREREPGVICVQMHKTGQPGYCFYDGPGEAWTEDHATWRFSFPVTGHPGWKWVLES
jgi:hypothetical protein